MAKRIPITTPIPDMETPWDNGTSAYTGEMVEEFIKRNFNGKYGEIRITQQKDAQGFYHLHCFKDYASAELYYTDPEMHAELLLKDIVIPLSTEQGTSYQFIIATNSSTSSLVSLDGTLNIGIKFQSFIKVAGQEQTENPVDGTLQVYGRASSTANWTLRGTLPISSANDVWQIVDVSQFAPNETAGYQLRLIVSVNDGEAVGSSNAIVFQSVTKTTMGLQFANSWEAPIVVTAQTTGLEVRYYITGVVDKHIKVKVWGDSRQGGTSSRIYTITPPQQTYTQTPFSTILANDEQMQCDILSHGVHRIESWLVHTASGVESPHITNNLMVVADITDTKPYLILQDVAANVQNYVSADLLKYAVYKPTSAPFPIKIAYTDYEGTQNYLVYEMADSDIGVKHTLTNTIEIENSVDDTIFAYLHITSNGEDILTPSLGTSTFAVTVDNREKFTPTIGAVFAMNPKTRNNAEANRDKIINAVTGEVIGGTFENFDWLTDGWLTDSDSQRCLRVPAGRRVTIPYNIFKYLVDNYQSGSTTIEIDFATRNVSDENTVILNASTTIGEVTKGIQIKPMEGVFFSKSNSTYMQQNYNWSEGERVHIAFNIVKGLRSGDSSTTLDLIRIFINGCIEREMMFGGDADEFAYVSGIVIGQDDADIDIYSIRCYNKALSSDDIQQDYVSSLPNADAKVAEKAANKITANGLVNFEMTKAKYNVLVWHGKNVSMYQQTDQKGWLEINMLNSDGTVDKEHSGTLTDLTMKGQGTTAKTYWEWNQQWQWKGETGSFVDLNGEDKGQKYCVAAGTPWAKKLVNKINYASPMQSHKQGATKLYNDLYKKLCITGNVVYNENPQARACVIEREVMCFVQDVDDPAPRFIGIGTFGSGKADKPTWGYDKSAYPRMAMMEGSDNNAVLCDMRCPWDDTVTYNPDEEYFEKGGIGQLDFDMGATDVVDEKEYPKEVIVNDYKAAWNFLYEHSPFIKAYQGTYEQMVAAQPSTKYEYYITQASTGHVVGDLHRFNVTGVDEQGREIGVWVRSQITRNGQKVDVNIFSTYGIENTGLWDEISAQAAALRASLFKAEIDDRKYFHKESLLFNHEFIKLIGGTDNRSKNTYYVNMPYNYGADTKWLITLHADDLDTIMLTNNVGWQSKPYYVEEQDSDGAGGYYWEGQYNVLFRLIELAYPDDLRNMMYSILEQMKNMFTSTVQDCLDKYFYSVQKYFPNVAYNESARLRYESAQIAVKEGRFIPVVQPISQSLGRQLECEKEFNKRRFIYLASYAQHGEFGGYEGWSLRGRSGTQYNAVFTVTPHQWLYPCGWNGSTQRSNHIRVQAGQEYVLPIGLISGDTNFGLHGINYMKKVGNVYNLTTNPDYEININSERLVEVVAAAPEGEVSVFAPNKLNIVAPLCKLVNLKGCEEIGGTLDLTGMARLGSVDVSDTKITEVKIPQTSSLTSVKLGARTTNVAVNDVPNLTTLTLQAAADLQSISITGQHQVDTSFIAETIYTAQPANLTTVRFSNINWTDVAIAMLRYYVGKNAELSGRISVGNTTDAVTFADKQLLVSRYGDIDSESNALYITYPLRAVTKIVMRALPQYPAVGDYTATIDVTPANGNNVRIVNGKLDVAWNLASNPYATVEGNEAEATLHVNGLQISEQRYRFDAVLTRKDGMELTSGMDLLFKRKKPEVGDFAYADGTFDKVYSTAVGLVGIAFMRFDITDEGGAVTGYDVRVVSLQDLTIPAPISSQTACWGLYSGDWSSAVETEIKNATGLPSVFDVDAILNRDQAEITVNDSSFIDDSQDDGYKVYADNTAERDFNGKGNSDAIKNQFTLILRNYLSKPIPTTLQQLADYMKQIVDENEGAVKYIEYYYPAPIACTLYEPDIPSLNDVYKKGNWYLPCGGEISRLYNFWRQGKTRSSQNEGETMEAKIRVFANAMNRAFILLQDETAANAIIAFSASTYWCTSEYDNVRVWWQEFNTRLGRFRGYLSTENIKSRKYMMRPVTAVIFNL